MYEGNPVDLQMEKVISADGIFDDTTRACRVYKYDIEDEYIYLELKEDEIDAECHRCETIVSSDEVSEAYGTSVLFRCRKREIPVRGNQSLKVPH